MVSKFVLDTNILIRFLTNNPKKQAAAVESLFKKAGLRSLLIPDVVLVEAVFVLLSFYNLPKEEIIENIASLITFNKFNLHRSLFKKTLELYSKYPISFVDAYVGAVSRTEPRRIIYTYDKRVLGIKEVQAIAP